MKSDNRICKCQSNKDLDLSANGIDLYISRCAVCPKRYTCTIYPVLVTGKKTIDFDGSFHGILQGTLESYREKSKQKYLLLVKHGFKLVVKNKNLFSRQNKYINGRK